jgi:hypothetical protein
MQHVDFHRLLPLVPPWAMLNREVFAHSLDAMFDRIPKECPEFAGDFYISASERKLSAIQTEEDAFKMNIVTEVTSPLGGACLLVLPIELCLSCAPRQLYSIYCHGYEGMYYVGLTKRPWWIRLNEHINDAQNGSKRFFHRAIRTYSSQTWIFRVIASTDNYDDALDLEEKAVGDRIYPHGLNMIPGGRAGIQWIQKQTGMIIKNEKDRDRAIKHLLSQTRINGRPNPLCSARWASDQEFVKSVICGHSNRLSVEELMMIRWPAGLGHSAEEIGTQLGRPCDQVERAMTGKTYGRIL